MPAEPAAPDLGSRTRGIMDDMTDSPGDRRERVSVRRAPKISVFLVAGAGLGILIAMILTFAFDGTTQVSDNTGLEYSQGQVFGFLALMGIAVGLALGGAVALVFDRVSRRRAREVEVRHSSIHVDEEA